MDFNSKTVLITGGVSGIGKIMVRKSIERGASKLIIWDIDEIGLEKTKEEFKYLGDQIYIFKVDISSYEEIIKTAEIVNSQIGNIDILINNAGIVVGKYFHEHTHQDINKSMAINADGIIHITLAFLPNMITRNSGAICNICSSAGLISNPKMSVYAASKWAAIGWSDSLRLEMKQLKKNISVTTIMPFYINTGMFDGVQSKLLPILKPEPTAEKILKAIERKNKMIAMPLPYWFIRLSQGIMPLSAFEWVMQHLFGIYDGMKYFKGRTK